MRGWPRSRAGLVAVRIACIVFALTAAKPSKASEFAIKQTRDRLADWGIAFSCTYIGEALGNVSGGVRRGAIYAGRLDLGTDIRPRGPTAGANRAAARRGPLA